MLRVAKRCTAILKMTVTMVALCASLLQAQNTTVAGVVRSADGEPLAGALVKVRSADSRLTFMVVSQGQGRYSTPNLLPGKYTVQAYGGDYRSESPEPVEVRSGQQLQLNIVLSTRREAVPREKRIANSDYVKMLPEGDGKRLIMTRCMLCHGAERIVPRRATQKQWISAVERMQSYMKERGVPLSDQEKDTITNYVTSNFGPEAPRLLHQQDTASHADDHLPKTLLTGAEAKYVAMEFYLNSGEWIHHLAVDSRGVPWVTQTSSGVLGSFDPKSFTYSSITPPPGKFPERFINAVRIDPQDNVWFTDNEPNGILYKYNPIGKEFSRYDIPVPPGSRPNMNTLRFSPDGSVWGTGITSSQILRLDQDTGKWHQYPVPSGSLPYGLAIGGDKMIWYSATYGNDIVRLDTATGKLTHYKIPTSKSVVRQLQADAEGNLWAAGEESGKLVRVDYRTGKVTEYDPPTKDSGPFSIDVDRKRNFVWFSESFVGKLARYDPRTNTFLEFPLPSVTAAEATAEFSDAEVIWIEVDRSNPNRVWWAGGNNPRIGYIEVME